MVTNRAIIGLAAYNELKQLPTLLDRIAAANIEGVIIYDDGSTDGSLDYLNTVSDKYNLTVLHDSINRGFGAGIAAVVKQAAKSLSDDDILVIMDADDTHDPNIIKDMVTVINQGYDVVIASRYQQNAVVVGIPAIRQLLSYACRGFWKIVMPIKNVRDYSSAYRAYRVSVLKKALQLYGADGFVTRNGFECQLELLIKLRKIARFNEIPIILEYDRKHSPSAMRIIKVIIGHLSLASSVYKNC